MPDLEAALTKAHMWAVFAPDGRLVRVGGLRGAPHEARDFATGIASQWQWAVPQQPASTLQRRERDGAHTMDATYRLLSASHGECAKRVQALRRYLRPHSVWP